MAVIDEILWLLKDGKWHQLREIMEKCQLLQSEVKMVVRFLWEYDFVELDEKRRKARLRPLMVNFIDEIQRAEEEEALGHEGFEGAVGIKKFKSLRRSFKKV